MAGAQITKGTKLYSNNIIGIDAKLYENVVLSPGVKIGNYVSISNIQIGENSIIESWVVCTGFGKGKIKIGQNCYIGVYNVLDWSDDITIGNFVHIAGPSTGLWTHTSAPMCLNSIPLSEKSKKFQTGTIDLNNSEKELFENVIHSKRRNMIRKAEKSVVTLTKYGPEGLSIYFYIMRDMQKKQV